MKITRAYLELKLEDKEVVYFFKNGLFYLVLNDDALLLRNLGFKNKIIPFGIDDIKMGFLASEKDKLEKRLEEKNLKYKFIENYTHPNYSQYIGLKGDDK